MQNIKIALLSTKLRPKTSESSRAIVPVALNPATNETVGKQFPDQTANVSQELYTSKGIATSVLQLGNISLEAKVSESVSRGIATVESRQSDIEY